MSTPTVITQRRAQPPLAGEAVAAPHAAQPDEPRLVLEQPVANNQTGMTRTGMTRQARSAASRSSEVLTLVGVIAVAGGVLFGIGWLWRDLKPVWRKLIYSVADVRIPIALPVTIGQVWWDFLADRRAMSPQAWRFGVATSDRAATRGRTE